MQGTMPTAARVKEDLSMLLRWPELFIQPLCTDCGLEYPLAMFSPQEENEAPAALRRWPALLPFLPVWDIKLLLHIHWLWARAALSPAVSHLTAPLPYLARAWLSRLNAADSAALPQEPPPPPGGGAPPPGGGAPGLLPGPPLV